VGGQLLNMALDTHSN